jgi:ubiquinone/menaquinone biosynthesis C-methylase UbiE
VTLGLGELYARFAFGPAAEIYTFVTDHPAWRASCRGLGALVPGPRVLDLGVGPGTSALEMAAAEPGRRYAGLDLSAPMLRRAARAVRRAAAPVALVQGDVMSLPVRAGAVDGVTGHSLLYLVADARAALAEMRRVLRPGGRVALLEPHGGPLPLAALRRCGPREAASMLLWRGMSRLHQRFDAPRMQAMLAQAGFRDPRAWPVLGGFGLMAVADQP